MPDKKRRRPLVRHHAADQIRIVVSVRVDVAEVVILEKDVGKSYVKLLQVITEQVPKIEPETQVKNKKEAGLDAGKNEEKEEEREPRPKNGKAPVKKEQGPKNGEAPVKKEPGPKKYKAPKEQPWQFMTEEPPGFEACRDEIAQQIFDKWMSEEKDKITEVYISPYHRYAKAQEIKTAIWGMRRDLPPNLLTAVSFPCPSLSAAFLVISL